MLLQGILNCWLGLWDSGPEGREESTQMPQQRATKASSGGATVLSEAEVQLGGTPYSACTSAPKLGKTQMGTGGGGGKQR